jgi:hypothetical protein
MMIKIWKLLETKYPAGEYALLREVRNAAGYNATRSADAVVVGFWPSRGCQIEGIERKSNRSDWLKELKQPAKAETIFKYCDKWWIFADKEGIVKLDEIPLPWGFMEIRGDKLKVIKQAPTLEPKPLSKEFVVSMIKRVNEKCSTMIYRESLSDELLKAKEDGKKEQAYLADILKKDIEELRSTVKIFEDASGVSIINWSSGRIGSAVKTVMSMGNHDFKKQLTDLESQAKRIHESIQTILKVETNV